MNNALKDTADSQSEAVGGPGTQSPALPKSSIWASLTANLKYAWPLLCLFQASLIFGWLVLSPPHLPESTGEAEPVQPVKKPAESVESGEAQAEGKDLRLADAYLREENPGLALPFFLAPGQPRASLSDQLLFRVGLCQEGLGKWEEASAAYREAVARATNPRMAAAAQMAHARLDVRQGKPREAKVLLFPLLLQSGSAQKLESSSVAEAQCLLALARCLEVLPNQNCPLVDDWLVRPDNAHWPIGHSVLWTTPAPASKEGGKPLPMSFDLLPSLADGKEYGLIRGAAEEMGVKEAVDKIAAFAKLTVEWSESAGQKTQGRTADLALEDMPLIEVVRGLTEPLGLVAICKDDRLRIQADAEVPWDELAKYRAIVARRCLRDAVLAHPEHPLAGAAYLELGNDEAMRQAFPEAAGWYERLLRQNKRSSLTTAAFFNLGLVHIAQKNYELARKYLFRVVDGSPGHELAPRAYFQIGWTYLLQGSPAEAVDPLQRAVATAGDAPMRPKAALLLAAAHLSNASPKNANESLVANREAVNREPNRAIAAFLDGLARYRVAVERKQSRVQSAELLAALMAFPEQNPLGCVGQLLRGHAFRELGMSDQMAKIYEEAVGHCSGAVADEMNYHLAHYFCDTGKRPAGAALLRALASKAAGKWSAAAQLRLAAISLEEGRPQECLLFCEPLLTLEPPSDRLALLKLMGQAHEALGNYEQAAQCYAGQLPK
jgi:tetratricopeptide (TPR) repeat protein